MIGTVQIDDMPSSRLHVWITYDVYIYSPNVPKLTCHLLQQRACHEDTCM